MPIRISIDWPASLQGGGKIGQIQASKSDILFEGGKALQELLADHMRTLDATRPNKLSGKRTHHFKPESVLEPVVTGDAVSVGITTPGITRALHDVSIFPKTAKMLAIPLHRDAYGMSPREYNAAHPKGSKDRLFRIKSKAGNLLLAKNVGKNLVLMYALKDHVVQKKDPSLLPTNEELAASFKSAVIDAIRTIVENT